MNYDKIHTLHTGPYSPWRSLNNAKMQDISACVLLQAEAPSHTGRKIKRIKVHVLNLGADHNTCGSAESCQWSSIYGTWHLS